MLRNDADDGGNSTPDLVATGPDGTSWLQVDDATLVKVPTTALCG